jgi:hypothetical protein
MQKCTVVEDFDVYSSLCIRLQKKHAWAGKKIHFVQYDIFTKIFNDLIWISIAII